MEMVLLESNLSDILDVSFKMGMNHSLAVPILVTDYKGNSSRCTSSPLNPINWVLLLTQMGFWLKPPMWLQHRRGTAAASSLRPPETHIECCRMVAEITSVVAGQEVPWANPAEMAETSSLDMSEIVGLQELFLGCRVRALSQRQMAAAFLLSGK